MKHCTTSATMSLSMNSPESKAAYEAAVRSIWPESSSMIDYCLKDKKHHTVLLPNGIVFSIEKPDIDKNFCFGYSSCGQGPEFKDACKAEDKARQSEEYFIRENMRSFDEVLKEIDGRTDTGNPFQCLPILRACNSNAPAYFAFETPYWHEVDRAIGLSTYYDPSNKGQRIYSEWRRCEYYIPTGEDITIIREAYEKARAEHEKRVRAYLKRYGLSKIRTWTYWLDE